MAGRSLPAPSWGSWGPQLPIVPPTRRGCLSLVGRLLAFSLVLGVGCAWITLCAAQARGRADPGAVATTVLTSAVCAVVAVRRAWRRRRAREASSRAIRNLPPQRLARARDPLDAVRREAAERGGGAYVGFSTDGAATWVSAHPEHAVLVLGPPRSGKTSAIIVPAVVAHPGAVVSTSTKPDVAAVAAPARRRDGEVWLFDPTGSEELAGVRPLRWSPVTAAASWDGALLMARAMVEASSTGRPGSPEATHWAGRAVDLLAPLLHAAALAELPMAEVVRWVLRADLNPAGCTLEDAEAEAAVDVLFRVADTHERERSSIFSTVANVLGAYSASGARRVAAEPNFDAGAFVASTDTVFVTTPAHYQDLAAPLVVGLLAEIRHAAYARARAATLALGRVWPPVLFALDECANIAPIHDLPAMVSEAGGQGLQVLACFQDLSQVRGRWGPNVADGFLSLFGTKVVLRDIADPRTLDALSVAFGEYDRSMVSYSRGEGFYSSDSTSYSTQRQRVLSPGEIANLPPGYALYVQGVRWWLVQLTPYYATNPWPAVLAFAGRVQSAGAIPLLAPAELAPSDVFDEKCPPA